MTKSWAVGNLFTFVMTATKRPSCSVRASAPNPPARARGAYARGDLSHEE